MPRLRPALLSAAVLAAALAAPASAELTAERISLLDSTLTAPAAAKRTCSDRPFAPGSAGVVTREVTAPLGGIVDARLDGSPQGGDWDLAVFDTLNGRLLNASAAFGANEVVHTVAEAGQLLTVQACRRDADAAAVRLTTELVAVSGEAPKVNPPKLVTVHFDKREQIEALVDQGIDFNHAETEGGLDAVLHSAADAEKIRAAGLDFTVRIPDLLAYDRKHVRTSFDPVTDQLPTNDPLGTAAPSDLPSGRRAYRRLIDYQNDLKALLEAHPGFVRPVTLPLRSVEGRSIEGIEIAKDVARTDDGRPTHVELGLHHVREWPSGEVTIEHAFTLLEGKGTPRIDKILAGVRTFVFPVINPDGLEVSMSGLASIPVFDDNEFTALPLIVAGMGPYRRTNCRPEETTKDLPCAFRNGIDLNRNYGAFWGGPGSGNAGSQTYRGPSPFSEPEAEAVHQWSSDLHVMVMNSNHTYAGDFLFQPGYGRDKAPGIPYKPVDKPIGQQVPHQAQMKELSDAMAKAAGYISIPSYQLYDVTGATEDWNYFAQSAFGYTTEVGYNGFHPNFQDAVIDQYTGSRDGPLSRAMPTAESTVVDGAEALGEGDPWGFATRHEPAGGLEESFLLAAEAAMNPRYHSVIEGTAPAGQKITLTKDFTTATWNPAIKVPEHLETTLTVPAGGRYEWHVNPSSRPVALIAGKTEAYTLTCGTQVLSIVIGMGEKLIQDLDCGVPPAAEEEQEQGQPQQPATTNDTPAPPAPAPAAVTASSQPLETAVSPAATCERPRAVWLPKLRKGERLVRVAVFDGRKLLRAKRGRALRRAVSLAGLPRRELGLRVVARTSKGRRLATVRALPAC